MKVQYSYKLGTFLKNQFGLLIPEDVIFKRMPVQQVNQWIKGDTEGKGKVINVSVNDFLTKNNRFNPYLEELVAETIVKEGLKIYAGIVSYDGRRESALFTGGNTFNNLFSLETSGLITRFLSYQGDSKNPSPLCQYALDNKIKVYFVDEVRILDKNRKILIDKKARGKTENILKFIMMFHEELTKTDFDPRKVFVLFLDDDYCLLDERAHYILIASWVLSYARSQIKDQGIKKLIQFCQGAGFIKNGGTRIHFHPLMTRKILRGEVIKNYRSLLIEAIKLDQDSGKDDHEVSLNTLKKLVMKLEKLPNDIVLTPENLTAICTSSDAEIIRQIMAKYFYPGGRVCKPFTKRLAHESEIYLNDWLSRFTYILHGDQGASLEDWLKINSGRGYAFEITNIYQFAVDDKLAKKRIIDVKNTPHAHQPQVQTVVEGMENFINLVSDCLKVFYKIWSVDDFIARYSKRIRVSWFSDGSYERTPIITKEGILFYPPACNLIKIP